MNASVEFRFYEELNDFLPVEKRKISFSFIFSPGQTVKDAIESLGVPHTEVDFILANGESVPFDYRLAVEDRIAVYPAFESFELAGLTRVREKPLRQPRFIADVHLGRLARWLRLLGLDTLYRNDYQDDEIIRLAVAEHRVILTRDLGILKHREVTHGYWLRSTGASRQAEEVLRRFDLRGRIEPFTRCLECNGRIHAVGPAVIRDRVPPRIFQHFTRFCECQDCQRVYWQGSHYERMMRRLREWGIEDKDKC